MSGSNRDRRLNSGRRRVKSVRTEFTSMIGGDPSDEQKLFFRNTPQGNDVIVGVPRCF